MSNKFLSCSSDSFSKKNPQLYLTNYLFKSWSVLTLTKLITATLHLNNMHISGKSHLLSLSHVSVCVIQNGGSTSPPVSNGQYFRGSHHTLLTFMVMVCTILENPGILKSLFFQDWKIYHFFNIYLLPFNGYYCGSCYKNIFTLKGARTSFGGP